MAAWRAVRLALGVVAAEHEALERRLAQDFADDRAAYTLTKVPHTWDVIRRADQWAQERGWTPGPTDA